MHALYCQILLCKDDDMEKVVLVLVWDYGGLGDDVIREILREREKGYART